MADYDLHPTPSWRLRTRTLAFGRVPLLMGIINVTPDSFSDGGHCFDAEAAIEHGLRLAADGADILDIGGESTRPGAEPVEVQEELRRVMPVVGALCRQTGLPVSIDTSKALVARHAIHAGAEIMNDVSALRADSAMLPLAVENGCGICVMHMQGEPRTMQDNPKYDDVVADVTAFLRDRRDALTAAGVAPERIALDPGIGFGKTTAHNLELLANIGRLHALGSPVLVGHSRKRFLASPEALAQPPSGKRGQSPFVRSTLRAVPANRDCPLFPDSGGVHLLPDRIAGTVAVALAMARRGVQVLRVHDVAAVRQALAFFQAAGGLD